MTPASMRDAFRAFTTTCALITVNGPRGPNVMAAEWTFNVSYDPFLIAVHVDKANVTHDEILAAGEFGVNLVSEDQGSQMRFAGHFSKAETDKLSSEVFETYPAKRIKTPMIRGSVLNAECRLVDHFPIGDHTAFIGEVLEFSVDPGKHPLILHHGSHRLGERIERRPALVMAATPAQANPGDQVTIHAELVAPSRDLVRLALVGSDGVEHALLTVGPAGQDSFEATVILPDDVRPGTYTVVARTATLEGRAKILVSRV
jgi:flavin reductase (DIM6/NTAB) family NADH-FMN oxidoreductase RutF